MMRANTNQAKKQLKPTHVHSIKKEPHKKEIPLEQREGCEIRALSIRKKPSVIKCNEKQKKNMSFFSYPPTPSPALDITH
jgi:hypothetical protein